MIKVLFDSHHFRCPKLFLESILRCTPKKSGKWKNIEATLDPKEADFYWIMDGETNKWPDMDKKAIYFGEHPNTPYSPIDKVFAGKEALLKLPLKDFLNPGEWWVDYDYDELTKMKPPKKSKEFICIATYQDHHPMYAQRQIFLEYLTSLYPYLKLDIYGRPIEKYESNENLLRYYKGSLGNDVFDATKGEHIPGKNILKEYNYSLEFDVGPCKNYFSERFYDAILLWCTPIYFGCENIDYYLPHKNKAYYTFDQHKTNNIDYIVNIIHQPKHIKEIQEVRNMLLNKYQMFAYCHHVVNNINAYLKNPKKAYKKWIKNG